MSIINTSLTGLIAAQRGLEATSNNVANAGTEGYVRRRITQAAPPRWLVSVRAIISSCGCHGWPV